MLDSVAMIRSGILIKNFLVNVYNLFGSPGATGVNLNLKACAVGFFDELLQFVILVIQHAVIR